jgi:hypothetical protein
MDWTGSAEVKPFLFILAVLLWRVFWADWISAVDVVLAIVFSLPIFA